jgi:hypothetical protein
MRFVHPVSAILLLSLTTATSALPALARPNFLPLDTTMRLARLQTSPSGMGTRPSLPPSAISQAQLLPAPLAQRIRQDIQRRFRVPTQRITMQAAQRRTWDACMGVAPPQRMCAQIAIAGWQVVAANNTSFWVYHISDDGKTLAFNAVASAPRNRNLPVPRLLDANSRIPTSDDGDRVLFQSAMTTGFAPGYFAIELRADGRLTRRAISQQPSTGKPEVIKRLSPQQVQQFMALLERNRFHHLNGVSYFNADRVAADAASFQLSDGSHVMEYTQAEPNAFPSSLRRIVAAWEQLVY